METNQLFEPQITFDSKIWKSHKPDIEDQFISAIISDDRELNNYEFITPQHFYQPQARKVWIKIK